ncbi:MAG: alpha-amylase family glycosyl hydrolase [Fusobacteriota bacterium]
MKRLKGGMLLFLAVIFLFIGCFKNNNEENINVKGVRVLKENGKINIYSDLDESLLGLEVTIDRKIKEKDLMMEAGYLDITNIKNEKTEMALVKLEDAINKGDKIFSVSNISGNVSIKVSKQSTQDEFDNIESILKNKRSDVPNILLGDFTNSGRVELEDLNLFCQSFKSQKGETRYNSNYDIYPAQKGIGDWGNIYSVVNPDDKVDLKDFVILGRNFNKEKPTEIVPESISISFPNNIILGEPNKLEAIINYTDDSSKIEDVQWEISDSTVAEILNPDGDEGTDKYLNGISEGTIILTARKYDLVKNKTIIIQEEFNDGIKINVKDYNYIWAWDTTDDTINYTGGSWPGIEMEEHSKKVGWYTYMISLEELNGVNDVSVILSETGSNQSATKNLEVGEWWYDGSWHDHDPDIDILPPSEIVSTPKSGNHEESNLIISLEAIDNIDPEPVIYYTLDGTIPDETSEVYTESININSDTTIKAMAVDNVGNGSEIFQLEFNLNRDIYPPVVGTSIEPGRYDNPQTLMLDISDDKDNTPLAYYTIDGTTPTKESTLYNGQSLNVENDTIIKVLAEDKSGNNKIYSFRYAIGEINLPERDDFRQESVYFLMTTRFYDGDSSNNRYTRWGLNAGNDENNDPGWRGDFAGLIEKLDYIKALGFSAIWITPPVLNRSDGDYHGYHAWDMSQIDGRLTSQGASYQDLIDAAHDKGLKVIQDIVLNHSSRYGEKNLGGRILWGDPDDPDWGNAKNGGEADYYDEYNPDFEYDGITTEPISGKSNMYIGDVYQTEKPTQEDLPWLWEDGDDDFSNNPYLEPYLNLDYMTYGELVPNLDLWGGTTKWTSDEGWKIYQYQWSEFGYSLLNPEIYHIMTLKNWEDYTCQLGSIHPDCVDLNTESKPVQDYLIDTYNRYIEMGVDGFRIDTVKHISRVMFNRHFIPAFEEKARQVRGKDDFYMVGEVATRVGEVWNKGHAPLSVPFYTWKERTEYSADDEKAAWEGYNYEEGRGTSDQPTSNNHYLEGNDYREPDYTESSGLDVIDFRMHWNFQSAGSAFNVKDGDHFTNDATKNLTYVESHDYSPVEIGGDHYARVSDEATMAENWSLMFTWRGIPTIYYGNEILFKAGAQIDGDPNKLQLEDSGRAYYGEHLEGTVEASDFGEYTASGTVAQTLEHPLAQHLIRLNKIRRSIPALQMGQYSTDGISGALAFKRRYTDDNIDSFALVSISGDASFSEIPNGRYVDAVTGDEKQVTDGNLNISVSGKGNIRIYVLDTVKTLAPGKIGEDGKYIY